MSSTYDRILATAKRNGKQINDNSYLSSEVAFATLDNEIRASAPQMTVEGMEKTYLDLRIMSTLCRDRSKFSTRDVGEMFRQIYQDLNGKFSYDGKTDGKGHGDGQGTGDKGQNPYDFKGETGWDGQGEGQGNGNEGESMDGDKGEGQGEGQGDGQSDLFDEFMKETGEKKPTQAPTMDGDFPSEINGVKVYPEMLGEYIKPSIWDRIVKEVTFNLSQPESERIPYNAMLTGPAGNGKTYMANALGKYIFNDPQGAREINPTMSKSDIYGYFDANGNYVQSALIEAIQRPGVLLLDEFCSIPSEVQTLYNPLLEQGRLLVANKGYVYRHPECVIIVCDNTNGDGGNGDDFQRNVVDQSVMDRMTMIVETEFDPRVATKIFKNKSMAMFIDTWNKACDKVGLPRGRRSLRAMRALDFKRKCGNDIDTSIDEVIIKGMPIDNVITIMKAYDSRMLTGYEDVVKRLIEKKRGQPKQ